MKPLKPRKKARKPREKRHPFQRHLPPPSDVDFPESNKPGAPRVPRLYSYLNDKSMRCSMESVCCDCGLVHHYTFEVFKASDNNWYLAKRSYRSTIASDLERKARKYSFREVPQRQRRKGKR